MSENKVDIEHHFELLSKAIVRKDFHDFLTLIQGGIDLECRNHAQQTPLTMACTRNADVWFARALLDAGADIHARDIDGDSPLICSVRNSSIELVDLLLDRGANINDANVHSWNSLMISCHRNSQKVFNHLLARNPLIHSKSNVGQTALMIACEFSSLETVKDLLVTGANPNDCDREGLTPLMFALSLRDEVSTPICDALLEAGASLDAVNNDGDTLLIRACANNVPAAVRWVLEQAPELLTRTNNAGWSARDIAKERSYKRCLHFIDAFEAAHQARSALASIEGACSPLSPA